MLLRECQILLLSLRLSQAEISRIRPLFVESERKARLREQARFLKCCKSNNVFPNTIENIHLPQVFENESMKSAVDHIKRFIITKMIRDLYRQLSVSSKKMDDGISENLDSLSEEMKANILSLLNEVFKISMEHHAKRLQNKFHHLKNKRRATEDSEDASGGEDGQLSNAENPLVTDLTKSLDTDEVKLLEKGPKFAIKKNWNETTKVDIRVSFCKLAYQMRWRNYTSENTSDILPSSKFPKYPGTGRMINPPSTNNDFENRVKMCYTRIQHLLSSVSKAETRSNLSKEDMRIIKNLREKPIVCLPSDKGGEFCVVESVKYTQAANEHLSDTNTYKKVARMSAPTIEKKINKVWRTVSTKARIPERIIKMFVSTNTELPKFYVLVKTHKEGPSIKIRPIVACRDTPAYKMSWLLSRLLNPLLKSVPAHLESSSQLMDEITNMSPDKRREFPYPFSLDIISLYTSVPQREAMEVTRRRIEEENICLFGLTSDDIEKLLEVILDNTYFRYEGEIYQQITGLPMGNSISCIMAIVFMDSLERKFLNLSQVGLFKRYIDDYCIFTTNREEAEMIFRSLNSQHPNIKFEIEHPINNSLSLLDFTSTIHDNGNVYFEFYKKKARMEVFVNCESAIPTSSKMNIIKNETKRITQRCTENEDLKKHMHQFVKVLKRNGYDEKVIETNRRERSRRKDVRTRPPQTDYFYFQIPFISDRIDHKIRKIFRDHDLPVRIAHRSHTLRQALQKKTEEEKCDLKNCPLNNPLCTKKNCVYKMTCVKCDQFYVGSTKRKLHIRIREHLNTDRSSVFRHRSTCNGSSFTVSILDNDISERGLRIREAILIQKMQPSINTKEECDELLSIIF